MVFGLFKNKKTTQKDGIFSKIKNGLTRTRNVISSQTNESPADQKSLDDLLIDIETRLLSTDMGMSVTDKVINKLRENLTKSKSYDHDTIMISIKNILIDILRPSEQPFVVTDHEPYVVLMVGINGAGKTTTIGKIAKLLQKQGKSCLIAAGDTFRAAAIEQIAIWGERNNIPVIQQPTGSDSASVIHDAISAAKARNIDVVLADTAGRLHTQQNLMQELAKVKKVIQKHDNSAPHETMLVVDASIGQNSLRQAEEFHKEIGLTGLVVTKLDGTAKGGIVVNIAQDLKIPIRYIGIGEGIDDLLTFQAELFVDGLID